jgi:ferric-dicitrate binding protein FerR (iron transport regulator)
MQDACSSTQFHAGLTRRAMLGAGVTAPLMFIAARIQAAERAGAVETLKGEAFAQGESARRALAAEAPVFVRDKVATGEASRIAMRLGKSTLLRLGERASITLDRFLMDAGGEITLETGPLLFERPEGGKAGAVRIRSPFGLIAVRGTRFFAGPSNDVFGVFVERGEVRVSAAGTSVTVRAGEGTNIARPGAAPTPPARWGAPRIKAALDSVT